MSVDETGSVEPRIGDTLRSARESRGLSIADVSEVLLTRQDYLTSIENMYAGGVPKGYLNGILRTYAGFLDLPADEIIRGFTEQCGAVSQAPKREAVVESNLRVRTTFRATLAGFAAAVVLVGAAGVGWVLMSSSPVEDTTTVVAAGTPVNGARTSLFAAATLDEQATQLPLTLTALEPSWLEVRGADGTIFRSRTMATGEVYYPRIGAGWTVSARNGAAFKWHVGDLEIASLGEGTAPVYAISIDAVAAEAQEIATPSLAAVSESKPSR